MPHVVFCRSWLHFTDGFAYEEFDALSDDEIVGALEAYALVYFRDNREEVGKELRERRAKLKKARACWIAGPDRRTSRLEFAVRARAMGLRLPKPKPAVLTLSDEAAKAQCDALNRESEAALRKVVDSRVGEGACASQYGAAPWAEEDASAQQRRATFGVRLARALGWANIDGPRFGGWSPSDQVILPHAFKRRQDAETLAKALQAHGLEARLNLRFGVLSVELADVVDAEMLADGAQADAGSAEGRIRGVVVKVAKAYASRLEAPGGGNRKGGKPPAAWEPPRCYVRVSEIQHAARFSKAGNKGEKRNPPRSTINEWMDRAKRKGKPVKKVKDPATGEVCLLESWVQKQFDRWHPRD